MDNATMGYPFFYPHDTRRFIQSSIKIPNNLISVIKFKENNFMTNKNLFQEAIADAKAVREAALANAKVALEEALTPRLQSMLAIKLEEMNYEGGDDPTDDLEEEFVSSHAETSDQNLDFNLEEEFDLAEILDELDLEEKRNKGGYTGKLSDEDEKTTLDTTKKDTAYSKLGEAKKEDDAEDVEDVDTEKDSKEKKEVKVKDMTASQLEDFVADIATEIFNQLNPESGNEMGGDEQGDEMVDMDVTTVEPDASSSEEDFNLEELLAELDAMGTEEETKEMKVKEDKKNEMEMREAISTIKTLRNELNEVNLLNAKLLYVNKIFKSKSLTESQKVHVIASFDKATTIKEAKVVFESLSMALTATKKPIKESLGFASKAAGIAPNKQIVESNDAITRMQKLANIIK
jgi:hypothetical protein